MVEFYQTIDDLEKNVASARRQSWFIVVLIMVCTYGLLVGIVHQGHQTILKQQGDKKLIIKKRLRPFTNPCNDHPLFMEEIAAVLQNAADFNVLAEGEYRILELVVAGKSNKAIGNELGLTEKTVKHCMSNILQKLQVRNRVEAALLAQKLPKR